MDVFPLTLREVTSLLGKIHGIVPEKLGTFQSRIKDFQRRGFPPGLNTGKGRPAHYSAEHLFVLALAFQLLELGLPPEKTTALVGLAADEGIAAIADLASRLGRAIPKHKHHLLVVHASFLGDLRENNNGPFLGVVPLSSLARSREVDEEGAGAFAAVDLLSLVKEVGEAIEAATNHSQTAAVGALKRWGERKVEEYRGRDKKAGLDERPR